MADFTRMKHEAFQTAKELGYMLVNPNLKHEIYGARTEGEVTRIMITCRHKMMARDGELY